MQLAYPEPPLTDGTIVLRRWVEGDLACVEEGSLDPDIPQGTTVPATFTPAEGVAWIERQWGRQERGAARGRGRGSRAVALLARWAVADASLERVEALVLPDNLASQRVLEKAGFRREGLLRSYLVVGDRRADALIYSLLPGDLD